MMMAKNDQHSHAASLAAAARKQAARVSSPGSEQVITSLRTLGVIAPENDASEIVALAQRVGLKGFGTGNHDEVIRSLTDMGAIAPEDEDDAREVVELAERVGLAGFAKPRAGQEKSDGNVVASLRALGIIGDEGDGQ